MLRCLFVKLLIRSFLFEWESTKYKMGFSIGIDISENISVSFVVGHQWAVILFIFSDFLKELF